MFIVLRGTKTLTFLKRFVTFAIIAYFGMSLFHDAHVVMRSFPRACFPDTLNVRKMILIRFLTIYSWYITVADPGGGSGGSGPPFQIWRLQLWDWNSYINRIVYLAIIEWGWVGYEEFCRSRRVLSTEVEGRGPIQNISSFPKEFRHYALCFSTHQI